MTGVPADGRADLDRKLTGFSRNGVIAALISLAALATGLTGEPTARGAVSAQARRDLMSAQTRDLTITPALMRRFTITLAQIRGFTITPAQTRDLTIAQRNRVLALPFLIEHGWSYRQYKCLDRLWMRESSWNHLARNPWSGAYGIPQALPAAKMRTAGTDWRTSPATQIKWGLGYIQSRYGNPCTAWNHSMSTGWY